MIYALIVCEVSHKPPQLMIEASKEVVELLEEFKGIALRYLPIGLPPNPDI